MGYQVGNESRSGTTVWVLDGGAERAEIAPVKGFNCFHWRAAGLDLLYADPQFLEGGSPTRTGIPILFPFPNRIRDGRFTSDGKEYQLPLNDPTKKNAIHGFACRRPWRIVDQGADGNSAWLTGEFLGSHDAPDCRSLWPADYQIRVTYRLSARKLRIEAQVLNPDATALPFGLGYHPYLRTSATSFIQVPAQSFWELRECLPSGTRRPVDGMRDLNRPKPFKDLTLDDMLGDLPTETHAGLCFRGSIAGQQGSELKISASPAFRETVVFTPPHRQAFCIEPYTCITDAINLQQRCVDAGWQLLPPGQTWSSTVELAV